MAYGGDPQNNPYAAPQGGEGSFSDEGGTKGFSSYAGFWLRLVAYFIDSFVVSAITFAILIPFAVVAGMVGGGPNADGSLPPIMIAILGLAYVLIIAGSLAYYAVMESSKYQATLGKMALGLKVTDVYGRRISLGRAFGRLFAKILSAIPCEIGFIMAGFTEKKQALHDMVAGTLVVKP